MTTQDIIQYYGNLLVLQYLADTGVQYITTVADVAGSLASTYFILSNGLNEPSGPYAVWFKVSGVGTAPSVSGFTNVEVDISTGASASAVASALAAVLNTLDFTTIAVENVVSLINDPTTPFAVGGDVNTEFVFSKNNAVNTVELVVSGVVMNQLPTQVQNGFNLNPTIQYITFSGVAASGSFVITYNGVSSSSIAWNSTEIQDIVNGLFGINYVTVSGSISTELILTFNINQAPVLISITSNTLETSAPAPVTATVSTNTAIGVQLDTLGKYAGVTRSGVGSSGPITLDDSDFLKLIQIAIVTNSAGSSLATIVGLLYQFFPGEIEVFDLANIAPMNMTYYINSSVISSQLLQLFIAEKLLPAPMGVGISLIVAPAINFFGYCDYMTATPTMSNTVAEPLNCATSYTSGDYNETWPILDYDYDILYA